MMKNFFALAVLFLSLPAHATPTTIQLNPIDGAAVSKIFVNLMIRNSIQTSVGLFENSYSWKTPSSGFSILCKETNATGTITPEGCEIQIDPSILETNFAFSRSALGNAQLMIINDDTVSNFLKNNLGPLSQFSSSENVTIHFGTTQFQAPRFKIDCTNVCYVQAIPDQI